MAQVDDNDDGSAPRGRWERFRRLLGRASKSYLLVIVIGIVIGLQVAPAVSEFSGRPVQGTVAVIPVQGGIDGENAASLTARLQEARSNPDIDAVVLQINSPGGAATASEAMYLQVARTARQMPVISSVTGIAASGAYYTAAPSDAIYVKPASIVGSVGVFSIAPSQIDPLDQLIVTGPNKLTGADRRDREYQIEALRRAFVGAVFEHRADELELSREEVSYAKIYVGSQAVANGMADEIGGLQAAIQRAAHEADLSRYRVRVLGYDGNVTFITRTAYTASSLENKELVSPSRFLAPPDETAVRTYLMLPPSVIQVALEDARERATVNATTTTSEVSQNGTEG